MIARETPLARRHEAAGAKLVHYAGWLLPQQFGPVAEEVLTCRRAAALFDISHMGVISLLGEEALPAARALLTRNLSAVPPGGSVYALLCNGHGGILDDLIALVETDTRVTLVVNAAAHDADFAWLRSHLAHRKVEVRDRLIASFGLALQGPRAEEILRLAVTAGEIPEHSFTHAPLHLGAEEVLVSRTGYTGEDGFELFGQAADGLAVWQTLLDYGAPLGLVPAGLAARDVLRQEMGYPLWGQDIGPDTTPLDAGLRWAIDWEDEFLGRAALDRAAPTRRRIGLVLQEPGIPRPGAVISVDGKAIGSVTSGTYSYHRRAGIGQGYVTLAANVNPGDPVEVEVRGKPAPARLARFPLVPARTRLSWSKVKGSVPR